MLCPQCGSANLRRSRARGLRENIQRNLGWKGYRCRDCRWRGMVRVGLQPQEQRKVKFAALLIAALLILYLNVKVISYLIK
jgi:hypothetical protein